MRALRARTALPRAPRAPLRTVTAAATLRRISTTTPLWTCNRCRLGQLQQLQRPGGLHSASSRFQSTAAGGGGAGLGQGAGQGLRRRRKLVLGVLAGGATLGALGYGWEDLRHLVHAAERAGRVAWGLAMCINDYRVTLKTIEEDPDPEKRDKFLAACHQRCADRTYKVLEKNGSIFIKLGQHLAAMGYLLPPEWTTTFIPLQDKCPVSSYESIENMIRAETGCEIEDLFDEFDRSPIGAASLAQVHRAKLKGSGQEVAVKLQHPALAEWIPLDIALTRFTFRNIKFFFPEYPLEWLSDEVESSLPQELDFTAEATNIHRMRSHFSRIPAKTCPLVVPTVVWAKPRVLVMEYLPGKRLDDLKWLDQVGISRDEVSAALARIFNEMVFGDGAPLHCDPHGGNLAIRINDSLSGKFHGRGFDIILYDHGLYREIPTALRRSYAKLWLAVLDADEPRMRKYAKEVAGVSDAQFPLFASAITGRDYTVLVPQSSSSYSSPAGDTAPGASAAGGGGILTTPRTSTEKAAMTSALMGPAPSTDAENGTGGGQGALLAQLMQLLAHVPPIILLILKTNDLTRSLDESLCTSPEAGVRVWLILARYCARTVFDEQMEKVRRYAGGRWTVGSWVGWWRALCGWWRVEARLMVFEVGMRWGKMLGRGGAVGKVEGEKVREVKPQQQVVVVEEKKKQKQPERRRESGVVEVESGSIVEQVKNIVANGGGMAV